MAAEFRASKTGFVNLKEITLEDGSVINGGTKCSFKIIVTGMLGGVEQGGLPNGEFAPYKAKFKIERNSIYGVRDLTIKNCTNVGNVDSEEYQDGEDHTGTVEISDDDDYSEVTMTILNPCGTESLKMEFALIARFPIEHNMIIPQDGDLVVENYENLNIPDECITINDEDYRMEASWKMQKHANKHIKDILRGDTVVPDNINTIHNDYAGSQYGKRPKLKTGTEPPSSIRDVIDKIEMNIKLGKITQEVLDNKTFVFVSVKGKQFIVTVSNTDTLDDLKTKILNMDPALDRQTLDSLQLKNQSTGMPFNPEKFAQTTCKEIANKAKGESHFAPQRRNIKWVSIE